MKSLRVVRLRGHRSRQRKMSRQRKRSVRAPRGALLTLVASLTWAAPAQAQDTAPQVHLERADGEAEVLPTTIERGFAAVPVQTFEQLGWAVAEVETSVALSGPHGLIVTMRVGSPFFFWNEEPLQMADAPYREGAETYIPLQLLIDFVPRRVSELYAFDGPTFTLRAADQADWGGTVVETRAPTGAPSEAGASVSATGPPPTSAQPGQPAAGAAYEGDRIVIIDPGHGGGDPGALGNRIREKNVALGIGLIMADLLEREPGIKVYLTRGDDTFVPIWDRGDQATEWKGEQAGVFISLHANALTNRSVRGFETYFLSEARTDHERRVAAIENAPLQVQGQNIDPDAEPDLGFILRELRTLDHQHWSALLAEFVQEEIAKFHPGPNRGVKQGVLAVLTNAVMPSVLVEIGFLSNDDEGPLLAQETFQDESARSIARAVLRFFERYPPSSGTGG
jgi:N-acetylmuramoyl-L-alanine amidase